MIRISIEMHTNVLFTPKKSDCGKMLLTTRTDTAGMSRPIHYNTVFQILKIDPGYE